MGNTDTFRGLLSVLLAVSLVFCCLPVMAGATEPADSSLPPVTLPAAQETAPAETASESLPAQTAPTETVPSETIPVVTDPEETVPATLPTETVSPETLPEETLPQETVPEIPVSPVIWAAPEDYVLSAGEPVTLLCNAAETVIYYSCSYDGSAYHPYVQYFDGVAVDDSAQVILVKAYGVAPDGTTGSVTEFRFTRESRSDPPAAGDASGSQDGSSAAGWNHYSGQLHAHSHISGGSKTVQELFADAKAQGLDFFAVTDYSDSFLDDSPLEEGGRAAAEATAGGSFVAFYGYEMNFPHRRQFGHIGTFGTDISYQQADFDTLESYYQALTSRPYAISQFNHPRVEMENADTYGNFKNFAYYNPRYDACIHLLEVVSHDGLEAYDQYPKALDQGWHVAPTNNLGRTVILAKALTKEALYEAIRAQRVYATQDSDLTMEYTLNGRIMGSVLTEQASEAVVTLTDPTFSSGRTVELLGDGGTLIVRQAVTSPEETLTFRLTEHSSDPQLFRYYYLQVREADGSIIAVTAPVWVELSEDIPPEDPSTESPESPTIPGEASPVEVALTGFTANPEKPAPGQTVLLDLTIDNQERDSLTIERIHVSGGLDTSQVYPITVPGLQSVTLHIPYIHYDSGYGEISVEIVGTAPEGRGFTLQDALTLFYMPTNLPASDIEEVRLNGSQGEFYKIEGFVTAGNSNPHTTFPNVLYLQDETGGIEIRYGDGALEGSLPIGKAVEVVGILGWRDGNLVLELADYGPLPQYAHRPQIQTLTADMAENLAAYGGTLVKAVGQVQSLTYTNENRGISRFTLTDGSGNVVTVRIDGCILSGTYGVNQLSAQVISGRRVQAIGILHAEADGTAVIRVRNCDEVTYAPMAAATAASRADRTNPRTGVYVTPFGAGIPTGVLLSVLVITAAGLAALYRLHRKKR